MRTGVICPVNGAGETSGGSINVEDSDKLDS